MPSIFMIQRSADSYGLPSIVKSTEDSEIDYNYDESSRWQTCFRTAKTLDLAEHLPTPLAIPPNNTFSEIPWTRGWTPRCPPRTACAEFLRRDDMRKIKRAKEKKQWLEAKAKDEARAVESAMRRASFEINISPEVSLGTARQLRPRIKKSYTGNITVERKGENKKGEDIKSKVNKNGDDIKSRFLKKVVNAKPKITESGDDTKSELGGNKKSSHKRILKESNTNEIKKVAVVHPISKKKDECHNGEPSQDEKKEVEVAMIMKATTKGQSVSLDIKSVAVRCEKEEDEVDDDNKENSRPKRAKKDNVRLSGYAKKWSL